MTTTDKIPILGSKAVIFKNKYDVWQFRMYVKNARRYVEKSLRTKERALAEERAEDLYIEIRNDMKLGKSFFAITIKEGVALYLEYRKQDVGIADIGIVEGRYRTIVTHTNHYLEYVNKDTKVSDLGINTLVHYVRESVETSYVLFRSKQKASVSTIRNEMSTINACQRYLYDFRKVASVPRFSLPKMPMRRFDVNEELVRRQTFERDEYESFYTALRSYVAKKKNHLTDEEYLERELVRHWILFAANSGLRSGEQRQIKWTDISVEVEGGGNKQEIKLAKVLVRKETSKVRMPRTLYCRGGDYIERWSKLLRQYGKSAEGFVFSVEGKNEFPKTTFHKHWKRIMLLTDIPKDRQNELVPYSLRHYMITQRVMSGCKFSDIAYMCGTSMTQIEKTYYHLNEEMMKTTAMATYVKRDGKVIPIGAQI
jgi:integrase